MAPVLEGVELGAFGKVRGELVMDNVDVILNTQSDMFLVNLVCQHIYCLCSVCVFCRCAFKSCKSADLGALLAQGTALIQLIYVFVCV